MRLVETDHVICFNQSHALFGTRLHALLVYVYIEIIEFIGLNFIMISNHLNVIIWKYMYTLYIHSVFIHFFTTTIKHMMTSDLFNAYFVHGDFDPPLNYV